MSVSYWVVLLAAVASFAFGGAWYGLLAKQWMAALGRTEADIKAQGGPAVPMIVAFLALLFMAWVLAGLLAHMLKAGVPATIANGMLSAAFIWAGFIATTTLVNHSFQGNKRSLTLIDNGHWLGVLLIQGAIIGGWGVR